MQPTEELRNERALAQIVLTVAAPEIKMIGITMQVEGERFSYLVELFSNFIDRRHHVTEEKGVPVVLRALRDNLSKYIEILDAHIAGENHVFSPAADRLLTAENQAV